MSASPKPVKNPEKSSDKLATQTELPLLRPATISSQWTQQDISIANISRKASSDLVTHVLSRICMLNSLPLSERGLMWPHSSFKLEKGWEKHLFLTGKSPDFLYRIASVMVWEVHVCQLTRLQVSAEFENGTLRISTFYFFISQGHINSASSTRVRVEVEVKSEKLVKKQDI